MVLFHSVVEVTTGAVDHLATQYPAYGAWVGNVPISSHSLGNTPSDFFSLLEEPPGHNHISPL